MEIKMERRYCIANGKPFSVMASSNQKFCSNQCEEFYKNIPRSKWADRKLPSLNEGPRNVKSISVLAQIPSGEQKRIKRQESVVKETQRNIGRPANDVTKNTKNEEIKSELNGLAKIRSDKMHTTEIITLPTKNDSKQLSTPAVSDVILPEESIPSYANFNEEISRSINSLNSVENELLSSMKGLRSQQPDPGMRIYDPEKVQTAVLCARQLVENMKMKIELLKLTKTNERN